MAKKRTNKDVVEELERLKALIQETRERQREELRDVLTHIIAALVELRGEMPEDGALPTKEKSIFDAMEEGEEYDDLYLEAKAYVISAGIASTSCLQRKLGIGYSRAARLIDMLENEGVVGPGRGSMPREVYQVDLPPAVEKSLTKIEAQFKAQAIAEAKARTKKKAKKRTTR